MLSSISGLYPLAVNSTPTLSHENRESLQALPMSPGAGGESGGGAKLPVVGSCWSVGASRITGL